MNECNASWKSFYKMARILGEQNLILAAVLPDELSPAVGRNQRNRGTADKRRLTQMERAAWYQHANCSSSWYFDFVIFGCLLLSVCIGVYLRFPFFRVLRKAGRPLKHTIFAPRKDVERLLRRKLTIELRTRKS